MINLAVFGFNDRGFSFEVQTSCKNTGMPINCSVKFDNSTVGTVFGTYRRGQFEGDSDIAGEGVSLIFFTHKKTLASYRANSLPLIDPGRTPVPGVFALDSSSCLSSDKSFPQSVSLGLIRLELSLLKLLFTNSQSQLFRRPDNYSQLKSSGHERRRLVDGFFAFLFTVSDSMTVLAVAYIFNFMATGKCKMCTYHYYVALDSISVACSTIVTTLLVSGHYYWKSFMSFLRFLASAGIFACLGVLIGCQLEHHLNFPEWNPPDIKNRSDSALLLPASCFLDPDLIFRDNPYAGRLQNTIQIDRVGKP